MDEQQHGRTPDARRRNKVQPLLWIGPIGEFASSRGRRTSSRCSLTNRLSAWIAQFGHSGHEALAKAACRASAELDDLLPTFGWQSLALGQPHAADG